jgi:hypothetical protein
MDLSNSRSFSGFQGCVGTIHAVPVAAMIKPPFNPLSATVALWRPVIVCFNFLSTGCPPMWWPHHWRATSATWACPASCPGAPGSLLAATRFWVCWGKQGDQNTSGSQRGRLQYPSAHEGHTLESLLCNWTWPGYCYRIRDVDLWEYFNLILWDHFCTILQKVGNIQPWTMVNPEILYVLYMNVHV